MAGTQVWGGSVCVVSLEWSVGGRGVARELREITGSPPSGVLPAIARGHSLLWWREVQRGCWGQDEEGLL